MARQDHAATLLEVLESFEYQVVRMPADFPDEKLGRDIQAVEAKLQDLPPKHLKNICVQIREFATVVLKYNKSFPGSLPTAYLENGNKPLKAYEMIERLNRLIKDLSEIVLKNTRILENLEEVLRVIKLTENDLDRCKVGLDTVCQQQKQEEDDLIQVLRQKEREENDAWWGFAPFLVMGTIALVGAGIYFGYRFHSNQSLLPSVQNVLSFSCDNIRLIDLPLDKFKMYASAQKEVYEIRRKLQQVTEGTLRDLRKDLYEVSKLINRARLKVQSIKSDCQSVKCELEEAVRVLESGRGIVNPKLFNEQWVHACECWKNTVKKVNEI